VSASTATALLLCSACSAAACSHSFCNVNLILKFCTNMQHHAPAAARFYKLIPMLKADGRFHIVVPSLPGEQHQPVLKLTAVAAVSAATKIRLYWLPYVPSSTATCTAPSTTPLAPRVRPELCTAAARVWGHCNRWMHGQVGSWPVS
jgi:hypothetical protein